MTLYQDIILDLYKNPLNHGELHDPSVTYKSFNPLCGDDITVDLKIEKGKIMDVRHRGNGCAISQASISLVSRHVKKKTLHAVMKMTPDDVVNLLGVQLGPVRLKCALLGLEAIHQAIGKFLQNNSEQ